jgi:hypothetical protein
MDREATTTPISKTYTSRTDKAIIVSDRFNDEVSPDNLDNNRIFHSDISNLRMVIRSNIVSDNTKALIAGARKAMER